MILFIKFYIFAINILMFHALVFQEPQSNVALEYQKRLPRQEATTTIPSRTESMLFFSNIFPITFFPISFVQKVLFLKVQTPLSNKLLTSFIVELCRSDCTCDRARVMISIGKLYRVKILACPSLKKVKFFCSLQN